MKIIGDTIVISSTKDTRLVNVISKGLDDVMSNFVGKQVRQSLEEEMGREFTLLMNDKLKDYKDINNFRLVFKIALGGMIEIYPTNLFSACLLNGYYIDPILIVPSIKKVQLPDGTIIEFNQNKK